VVTPAQTGRLLGSSDKLGKHEVIRAIAVGGVAELYLTRTVGAEGLEKLAAFAPDVMLVDIGLPGMDGYDLARRVRSRPEARGVALIALTGYGQVEDRRRAQAAGFDLHLTKPVDPERLEKVLGEIGRG